MHDASIVIRQWESVHFKYVVLIETAEGIRLDVLPNNLYVLITIVPRLFMPQANSMSNFMKHDSRILAEGLWTSAEWNQLYSSLNTHIRPATIYEEKVNVEKNNAYIVKVITVKKILFWNQIHHNYTLHTQHTFL